MLRILIADDNEFIRKGLKQILTEEFPAIYIGEAEDADELITMACAEQWSMIISDISMPGGGGLKALKTIKQQLPGLPVLVLSVYPEEQFSFRVMLAGASGFLNKDSAPEALIQLVKNILGL